MKKTNPNSQSQVDVFGFEVKENRRDSNHFASKTMTRFTVMMTLVLFALIFRLWVQ
jgi:hypothetical protein